MTQASKIKTLEKALRYYQSRGTKIVMVDSKGKLLVENGHIANRALLKCGLVKRKKPIQYIGGIK